MAHWRCFNREVPLTDWSAGLILINVPETSFIFHTQHPISKF